MKLLVFDPSGNWEEGNGTTGWALFEDGELKDFGAIKAKNFDSPEAYWDQHEYMIMETWPDVVVCESYRLQAGKAMEQSWSRLETPQLIGVIRYICWMHHIPLIFQDPSIKPRFNDDVLVRMGLMEKRARVYYIQGNLTNDHIRDAIRHGLYYLRYGRNDDAKA